MLRAGPRMRLRPFAAAPLVSAGLALALSSAMDAGAREGDGNLPGATRSVAGTRPNAKKRRAHLREDTTGTRGGSGRPFCAWGDCAVAEGHIPAPMPGGVCPPEAANVEDRFCIDRWEASLVEVLPDGRSIPWPPFDEFEEGRGLRAASVPNTYPQAYISGAQAASACAAAGKRLCAPVEWRAACYGPRNQKFGYGDERISGRCNDEGRSPMLELYPQVATSWNLVGMAEMNDPRLNQLPDTVALTGSHEGCTNEYGVYDMVGNLHEWTNDPHGTFQGGYYLDTHKNGDGCAYRTVAHEVTYHDYSTGFRCCSDLLTSDGI
jgi:sulfatase modifying factor 1